MLQYNYFHYFAMKGGNLLMNKLGMLLASAVLLTSVASVQVHAADNLDITKTPYKLTLHESATVVIPWNANYSWELAAAQGGGS